MKSFFLKGARLVLWNMCIRKKYKKKIIGKHQFQYVFIVIIIIFFFWGGGDGEMKYVFDGFGPLVSFQNEHLQNVVGFVL